MKKALPWLIMAITMMVTIPALAHHKDGHENGPKQGAQESPESSAAPSQSPASDEDSRPDHGCEQASANDGDAYDSTCDGSPSENGSGDGEAKGKPCAGCVGAADNKNPLGQAPNGSDDNNGYECDGNQGVGKTNPAHTGCVTPTPTPTTTPCEPYSEACPTPTPTITPSPSCEPRPGEDENCTEIIDKCIDTDEVCGDDSSRRIERDSVLPVTGRNVLGFVFVALAILLIGALILRASKR